MNTKGGRDEKREIVESITEAEWTVVKVLWAESPLTGGEIVRRIKSASKWNPKTIYTLISRLVQKGVIKSKEDVRPYSYYPLLTEAECSLDKTLSLIDRVFNGSFSLMVSRFVNGHRLSSEEIDELKKILDRQ